MATSTKARPKPTPPKKAAKTKSQEETISTTPTPPTETSATWQHVSPEQAAACLDHNTVNRDIKLGEVALYSRQMEEGRWGTCIEPIAFDEAGNLVNGQHRLTAQVETNTSQWWLVLEGVPSEAAKTVNGGARNRLADILKYNGEKNYVVLAGVTNNTYLWAHDLLGVSNRIGPLEGEEFLEKHPDLRHSTEVAMHVAQVSVIDISSIVLGTAHWIISQSNGHAEADLFLFRMAHLQNERPGSGIIALLNRLNKGSQKDTTRPKIRDQIAAVIKVWNYEVEERFVRRVIIGNRTGWENPVPLKKDTPITDDELHEMTQLLPPAVSDVVPDNPEDIVDEGEE